MIYIYTHTRFMQFNWKNESNRCVCILLRYDLQMTTWFTAKKTHNFQ